MGGKAIAMTTRRAVVELIKDNYSALSVAAKLGIPKTQVTHIWATMTGTRMDGTPIKDTGRLRQFAHFKKLGVAYIPTPSRNGLEEPEKDRPPASPEDLLAAIDLTIEEFMVTITELQRVRARIATFDPQQLSTLRTGLKILVSTFRKLLRK